MNDTHPTIAVAELMRLLIDQEGLNWEEAWSITTQVTLIVCSYLLFNIPHTQQTLCELVASDSQSIIPY